MITSTSTDHNDTTRQHRQELKALLRLVNDLGYEVQTTSDGKWVVSTSDQRGDHEVVGIDDAETVAAGARELARMLHIDQPARTHAIAH